MYQKNLNSPDSVNIPSLDCLDTHLMGFFNLSIMETKICFKCGIEKPLNEFYRHKQMRDGHLNKCKACTKLDTATVFNKKIKDDEFHQKEKERGREKYYRLRYKDKYKPSYIKKKEIDKRYKEKYPEKRRALSFSGKLKPVKKGNHLHHWSYNEEHYKDVIELTPIEHSTLHRFIVYDQERMMYRVAKTGILLDSKKYHIEFLKTIINK